MKLHILTMSRGDSSRLLDWILYHQQIGFDYFHLILDNPNDDSVSVLEDIRKTHGVWIEYEVREAAGEYFDGLTNEDRLRAIKNWRKGHEEYISQSGYPIVDPLSDRQYQLLPDKLDDLQKRFPEDWVAVIDVDEYVAIPGSSSVKSLVSRVQAPRLRLLNFNFDMSDWQPGECVRLQNRRWSRSDIVEYGKGWDNRVKSIVKLSHALPMVSVHAVSAGPFEVAAPESARLHHYKYPNQKISLRYSILDSTIATEPVHAGDLNESLGKPHTAEHDTFNAAAHSQESLIRKVKNLREDPVFEALASRISHLAGRRKIIFSPSKGNWGDGLINFGTRQFFEEFQIKFIEQNKSSIEHDLERQIFRDEIVVIGGGGAWCRNFNSSRKITERIADQAEAVIVLPTTYDLGPVEAENVQYFARDYFSSSSQIPDAEFCHDMALFTDLEVLEPSDRVWRLFSMRDDREGLGLGKCVPNNFDLSRLGDGDYRFVGPFFNILNNFKVVWTDRMHIAIAGAMLGRDVKLVPGNYPKSIDVFESSLRENFPNVEICSAEQVSEAVGR
mgnify:CR=1 FL=1